MGVFLDVETNITYNDNDMIRSKINESLDRLETSGNAIRSGQSVVIKANIIGAFPIEKAVCTNPVVVRCVVEELQKRKVNVTIAEECMDTKAPQMSGILEVVQELRVKFINLYKTSFKSIDINGTTYEYYEELLKYDHLILIPKLKTDILTYYTGAIKLMYGAITKRQRVESHKYTDPIDFAKILVNIYSIRIPTLTIMDGIVSMDGAGPIFGTQNPSGLLLISNDAVVLDYYASSMMKYDPLKIDMIRMAIEQGLASAKPEEVKVIGCDIKDIHNKFDLIPKLNGEKRIRFLRRILGVPKVNESNCLKCGSCIGSCPYGAITLGIGYPLIEYKKCKMCFCCMGTCQSGAIVSDYVVTLR
jgi:uncharacterized protein (DUF362 family)/Pyruvate/2-oxoacid:ferredoxin oxidoreductase delta subunit